MLAAKGEDGEHGETGEQALSQQRRKPPANQEPLLNLGEVAYTTPCEPLDKKKGRKEGGRGGKKNVERVDEDGRTWAYNHKGEGEPQAKHTRQTQQGSEDT